MKSEKKAFIYLQKSCNVNLAMIKQFCGYLVENDYSLVDNQKNADLIVFCGCALNNSRTGNTEKLMKLLSIKYKDKILLSLGCISSDNKIRKKYKNIKFVSIKDLELLDEVIKAKIKFFQMRYSHQEKARKYFKKLIKTQPYKHTTKNKQDILCVISRGCLGDCSYCTDKIAIGNVKSKKVQDIIKEIKKQVKPQTKNIYLVADDCGCYGQDVKTDFVKLLNLVLKKFPKQKISFYHLNPYYLNKYFEEYKKIFLTGRILSSSITLQSMSKRIIKLMNRYYDPKDAMEKIKELKQISPKTKFTSHFLVGFPTETEKEFKQTMMQVDFFDKAVVNLYERNLDTESAKLKPISQEQRGKIIAYLEKNKNENITLNI